MSGEDCPKCEAAINASSEACPSCGLSREHFASFAGSENALSTDELAQSAAWQRVRAAFDDEEAHEAFLHEISTAGRFQQAAALYRRVRGEREEEISQRMLERIRRMAAATMQSRSKVAPPSRPLRGSLVLLIFLVMGALIAGGIAVSKLQGAEPTRPPRAPSKGKR